METKELAEEESAEKPEKPEKRVIKTNPVFREIFYKCWEKSRGTEDRDRVQIQNYQTLINESVKELYPQAESLSSFNRADLWKTMKRFGLAESQGKGKFWDLYLNNPNRFNWDCQKKAQYNWLPEVKEVKAKAEPEVALPGIPLLPETPTEITQAELEKAKARWGEFRENMDKLRQNEIGYITASCQRRSELIQNLKDAEQTYQALLAGLTEIVTLLERLQELEQKKISLLEGEEESETDERNEENDEAS